MTTIEIGGRLIPLAFTLGAWADMEEQICHFEDLKQALDGKDRIGTILKLVRILGNAAYEDLGMPADLTDAWLRTHMQPAGFKLYQASLSKAITDGMKMETEENRQKERDLVLEEIQKKSKSTP